MALKVTLRLQGTVIGEQVNWACTLPVPEEDSLAAKQRIGKMLATHYDGMPQKPEVIDVTPSSEILVSFEGTDVTDIYALFTQMQAAALNTTVVTHG